MSTSGGATADATGNLSRRSFLRRAGATGAALAIPGVLAACGDSGSTKAATGGLTTVRLGVPPYADHSIHVVGIRNGWFKEAGIDIQPKPDGFSLLDDKVVPQLVNGRLDISSNWGPFRIQTAVSAPRIRMFGFGDTYTGTYILASPNGGAKSVKQLMQDGQSFDDAVVRAMSQLRGKRITFDDTGSHQAFFNTVFALGKVKASELKIDTLADAKIVQLARGNHTDFVSPTGAAQNVALLDDGWFPLIGVQDLINNLPPGDPRAVSGVGHTGPATTIEYYRKNGDTVMRFMSVFFRVIDAIRADLKNGSDKALAVQLPYLEAKSGTKIGLDGLRGIFKDIDPLMTFEDQRAVWLDPKSPVYFKNIYQPQVDAAKKGGILPAGADINIDNIYIGADVYRRLLQHKQQYEQLRDQGKGDAKAKARAERYYEARNYLDAQRTLAAT
jgi:ABC-type nitrate/sulfonate/bicarbonate transport system substrate-binding protein